MMPGILVAILVVLLVVALMWGWRQRRTLQSERAYWEHRHKSSHSHALPPLFIAAATALESGLILLDHSRRIAFANESFQRMLAGRQQPLLGHSVIAVLRDHQLDALIKAAISSRDVQSTTLQPPLSPQTFHVTCYPLDNDEHAAIVLVRDVTQLAHLERARREMVANVSHELRTPLASIKLLVETLQTTPPPAIAERMLGQIDDELDAMTQLVDELRELSQIESGRMALTQQPTNLRPVIERAVERLRRQAARRDLSLVAAIPEDLPPALLDSERITLVLLNLLSNAIKFTPPNGTITIAAEDVHAEGVPPTSRLARELAQARLERAVLVSIKDTGIGIPASEVDRVFERFYKVDRARTRNSSGTGLGLAIAKHLVERHGGRIWVESREGEGSVFSLVVPLA